MTPGVLIVSYVELLLNYSYEKLFIIQISSLINVSFVNGVGKNTKIIHQNKTVPLVLSISTFHYPA
jgi:hypothetical protein